MPSIAILTMLRNWFVALPDAPAAEAPARSVRPYATERVDHPSGRPWLLGRWPDWDVAVAAAGPAAVAVLGEHAVRREDAAAVAARLAAGSDADAAIRDTASGADPCTARMTTGWPGNYHVIISSNDGMRLRGGISALRRVFIGTGPVPVAADRADVLAALLRSDLDPARVAAHLLDPQTLHPIAGQPVWRGLAEIPGGHYLRILHAAPTGPVRWSAARWWSPPDPVVPLAEGAANLSVALTAAVQARTRGRSQVTCDLGGLDSTAVCSVAAVFGGSPVAAFTVDVRDPLADDVRWARKTVAGLGIEHHVVPGDQMPLTYEGLAEMADLWDEPCSTTVDRNRWLAVITRAAERGSAVHLTGIGGDELLYGSTAHLHALARRHPVLARRTIRGFAAKYRWPTGRVLRQLLSNESYGDWLRRVATALNAPPQPLTEPLLEWGFQPRLPPWATRDAADAVRGLVRAEVDTVRPISTRRGLHRELAAIQLLSRTARQLQQLAADHGVRYAAPYYDDAVMIAALSVRPQDRITPWRYKPLIVEAMRGIVPEASRARVTKANAMVEEEEGLRVHRAPLLDLWEDSALARLGLVDAAALRDLCARPLPKHLQVGVLHQTVAAEVWLRAVGNVRDRTPVAS